MKHQTGVSNSLVTALLQGALHSGLQSEQILNLANVPVTIVDDPQGRLSLKEFSRVVETVFVLLNDEFSGFLQRPMKSGSFAMMCHATLTCPNLRRALLRGAKFMDIVTEEIRFKLTEQGEEAYLRVYVDNHHNIDNQYFIMSIMIIWIRWSSWMIDQPLLLERVNFNFSAPDFVEDFDSMFPCRHYFDQAENGFVINQRFLEQPIKQSVQSLADFLAKAPRCLLTNYQSDDSLTAQIRRMLNQEGKLESLTFEAIADVLNMTTQTLRRRLKTEGNSFQEIKDSLRRDTAIYHLSKLDTPINDIATLLGFSEPSAFNRAFKKWTGLSPGNYRNADNSKAKQQETSGFSAYRP